MVNYNQTINNLTFKELETLIETVVKRTLNTETQPQDNINQIKNQTLLNTFNTWEDEQTEEEIIKEIYNSRNSNLNQI